MRTKKHLVTFLALVLALVMAMPLTASADPKATWRAAKGTAVIDGVKDHAYSAAQEIKMTAVANEEGKVDDTKGSAWAIWDDSAFYMIVEVIDSKIDGTNTKTYRTDSVEFRVDGKDNLNIFFAKTLKGQGNSPTEEIGDTSEKMEVSEYKIVTTKVGYNVEFKVPYKTSKGKAKFVVQVNACSNGNRTHTLTTNFDVKDAWQNYAVFETLLFTDDVAGEPTKAPAATATATAAKPTAKPKAGTYKTAQTITLSAEKGATIYYTTNGKAPTTKSTKYSKAFKITKTTTVKAISVVKDKKNSPVATFKYVIK